MRTMDLDHFHPGLARHPCRSAKLPGNVGDFGRGQRMRGDGAGMERNRARRHRYPTTILRRDWLATFPGARGAGLAACMGKLDARNRAAAADDRGQARQQRPVLRIP